MGKGFFISHFRKKGGKSDPKRHYQGLIPGRDEDIVGIALAYASISEELRLSLEDAVVAIFRFEVGL